jgi:hypothetical protein
MGTKLQQTLLFISDREKIRQFVLQNQTNLKVWGMFCVVMVLVFCFFSDGDFSFLLTLSAMLSMFSFLMVVVSIVVSDKHCAGVSLKMNECYLLVSIARLSSILCFEGYLPFDRSGDWVYKLLEILNCVFTAIVVYFCRVRYNDTYNVYKDMSINHAYLIGGCLVFALFFHPSLNEFMPTDIAWAFALYLESVSAMPQLFMFHQEGEIEPFIPHFLAGQTFAKFLGFSFWAFSYSELNNPAVLLKQYVGHWVILVQLFQLILMGDFMYRYVICLRKGISVSQICTVVEEV